MKNKPERVLVVFNGGCVPGGVRNFVINLYRNLDRTKIQFNFLVFTKDKDFYYKELEDLGGRVILITDDAVSRVSLFGNTKLAYLVYKAIKKNGPYKAIHCNSTSDVGNEGLYLLAAKLAGVKVRICHSHFGINKQWNIKARLFKKFMNLLINSFSTHKIGCSKLACKALYGNNCFTDIKVASIYNGIDLSIFNKNSYNENKMNEKYKIDNLKINFINIGRFDEQKNQLYLLEVFRSLLDIRNDVHLNIVGYGHLKSKILDKIRELNLERNVTLFKEDSNIPELLSTMDYFLLPSVWEGFPIVLVEAQAMELPCFVSDTVTDEIDFGLCNFIPIDRNPKIWAEKITYEINTDKNYRKIDKERFKVCDSKYMAKSFTKIYLG
jgi:glycosyltransferase involved in cell wall biosynthesis